MSISVTSARTAIYLLPYINHSVTVAVQLKQEAGATVIPPSYAETTP